MNFVNIIVIMVKNSVNKEVLLKNENNKQKFINNGHNYSCYRVLYQTT